MSAAVSFDLPFPPSVNGLFAGKARRYASPAYKAWKAAARPFVPAGLIAGPYTLDLLFDRPDRRARDLGNLEKAVSDLIVERGLVIDDSCCQRITLAWSDEPPQRDAVVRVTVSPHSRTGE
jgi:crossover junction endodeoxyribonuclease RusA